MLNNKIKYTKILRRYNNIFIITLFIIIMIIPGGAFGMPPCCNNFTSSFGTQIDSMDNDSAWANSTNNDYDYNYKEGTGGINISLTSAQTKILNSTINKNISGVRNIVLWVYVNFPSKLSAISIAIGNNKTSYYSKNLTSEKFGDGWNYIVVPWSTFSATGSPSVLSNMTHVQLDIFASIFGGKSLNLSFDNIGYNHSGKAKAIITFDDGNDTIYTNAFPIMQANNQKGVVFMITSRVGVPGNLSLTQLKILQDAGWDISSHTENHSNLVTLSEPQIISELNNSFHYLYNNGFQESAWFVAYPYGNYNQTVLNYARNTYLFGRSTLSDSVQDHLNFTDDKNQSLLIKIGLPTNSNVDYAIERNGTHVALIHRVVAVVNDPTIEMSIADFQTYSDYLETKSNAGLIDVITFSDYVLEYVDFEAYFDEGCVNYLNIGLVGSAIFVILIIAIIGGLAIGAINGIISPEMLIKAVVIIVISVITGVIGIAIINPIINLSC